MTIRKLRAARVNTTTASTFVGQVGDIFYDEHTGQLKVSDGRTAGGSFIPLVIATPTTAGAIKAGPGANVSVDGTLTIDTTGLPLGIGDLDIVRANISTVNANEDLNLISNGTGAVNIVGNLHVHTTAQGPDYPSPILEANNFGNVITNGNLIINGITYNNGPTINDGSFIQNGNITVTGNAVFTVSLSSTNKGAVEITGNVQTRFQTPNNTGVMLHVTGVDDGNSPSRIYNDGVGQYALYTGRRYNGTIANPTQVLANQDLVRYGAAGYTSSGWPVLGVGRMAIVSSENYTSTAQGSRFEFWAVANATATTSRVATIDPALGVTAAGFITPTTTVNNGIVTSGNITAANVNAAVYGDLHGKLFRPIRNAGTIADGGTLTVDFSADSIVYCSWANGMTLSYQNYTPGRVVKVIAAKAAGSGTDSLSLDGINAAQTSSGSTTISAAAGQTYFIELICVGTTINDLYAKL